MKQLDAADRKLLQNHFKQELWQDVTGYLIFESMLHLHTKHNLLEGPCQKTIRVIDMKRTFDLKIKQ